VRIARASIASTNSPSVEEAIMSRVVLALVLAFSVVPVVGLSSTAVERRAVCTISGTVGNDVLRGTDRRDVICGFRGNDWLIGKDGGDLLLGGAGDDNTEGNRGNDVSKGGKGSDYISDGPGADVFRGGGGNDHCLWAADGDGNDVVDGGLGNDRYTADPGDTVRAAERKVAVCDPRPIT
jgi:Ca2+-binding RTX toxin-like protein